MKKFRVALVTLTLISLLAGCSGKVEEVEEEKEYISVLDLTYDSYVSTDLNSVFVLEALRTARDIGKIDVIDEADEMLLFQYRESDREVLCTVSWGTYPNGQVSEFTFNNRSISNKSGQIYLTSGTQKGSLENLPNTVKVYNEASELGSPCFVGVKSGEYLQMMLDANTELAGLYKTSRSFVTDFLVYRILSGDSLEEYWQTENQVYSIIAVQDGGKLMMWYDNGYLTISGDFEQRGDV